MYFPLALYNSISSATRQCWENDSAKTGTYSETFFSPCVRQIYFLQKSTELYDMRTECQIIVIRLLLLIYHKSPAIAFSPFTPQSLPNRAPVCWSCAVKLLPCLRGCKLETSFKYSLSLSRSLFSELIFNNISHLRSIRLSLAPTYQTFCLP